MKNNECFHLANDSNINKIIFLVPSIDISEPLGATIHWWQLLKNLYNVGIEIIVIPFIGRSIETPWWRCYPNPIRNISKAIYSNVKRANKKNLGQKIINFAQLLNLDKALGSLIEKRWINKIDNVLRREKDVDSIIMSSLPIRTFENFSRYIKNEFDVQLIYYEVDMPEVLPEHNTFGYSYYKDVDLSIFDGYLSNSDGVKEIVRKMGAKNISTLHYAIDPDIYRPFTIDKNIDILFSGVGTKGREEWMDKMIFEPAKKNLFNIALSGRWGDGIIEGIQMLGFLPFNKWLNTFCSSKINLDISRFAHANVYKTSTQRIFELCGMGCSVIANPHKGLEEWYTHGKEIYILSEDEEPIEVYSSMLSDNDKLIRMGEFARERTLKEHTYEHRVISFLNFLNKII